MLEYAEKLTKIPQLMSNKDALKLKEAGFSNTDLFDIADVTAFFNYTNRMALSLDMMPNHEYHAKNR